MDCLIDDCLIKIKYLISEKKVELKIALIIMLEKPDNFLLNEKILTFHDVITLIKSAVNKNKSEYYGNIFLEKGSCKDKFDTRYF